jgi:hypothetical protein
VKEEQLDLINPNVPPPRDCSMADFVSDEKKEECRE